MLYTIVRGKVRQRHTDLFLPAMLITGKLLISIAHLYVYIVFFWGLPRYGKEPVC